MANVSLFVHFLGRVFHETKLTTKHPQIIGARSSEPPLQSGSYMFYALEPHSQYEVVIQGQNRWGWAQNSEPFVFTTRSTGKRKGGEKILSEGKIRPPIADLGRTRTIQKGQRKKELTD